VIAVGEQITAETPTIEQGVTAVRRGGGAEEKGCVAAMGGRTQRAPAGYRLTRDYSEDRNASDHFSHDQAWSRAYHWSGDGNRRYQ
jgi:hypothetical protein